MSKKFKKKFFNEENLFKSIFKDSCKYGYQDHISGDNEMSSIIPFISMSLGLDFIEKHVTLDRSKKGVDYYSSLEPKELKNFISLTTFIILSFIQVKQLIYTKN